MPSDIIEPPAKAPGADEPAGTSSGPIPIIPQPVSSTSGDELTVSLTQARPDPLLGSLDVEAQPGQEPGTEPEPAEAQPEDTDAFAAPVQAAAPDDASRAEAFNALAKLDVNAADTPVVPLVTGFSSVSSTDALAAIDLAAPPSAPSDKPKADEPEADEDGEDDDEPPARGSSWATVLLASYASAVTLGLVWVLWTGRGLRNHDGDEPDFLPPADSRVDPGLRASHSRKISASPPIAASNLATFGKAIQLGLIEVTPLEITSGPVKLERNLGNHETKPGGDNALKLRLRLRNTSTDKVIAPLDEAFLRERVNADPDSFIETGKSGETLAMFPLAVESEWSIVGQTFRDLKPGEVLESVVVSAPDAVARKTPEMTWRVRLRTDINHTDTMGVRFQESQIKPGP